MNRLKVLLFMNFFTQSHSIRPVSINAMNNMHIWPAQGGNFKNDVSLRHEIKFPAVFILAFTQILAIG